MHWPVRDLLIEEIYRFFSKWLLVTFILWKFLQDFVNRYFDSWRHILGCGNFIMSNNICPMETGDSGVRFIHVHTYDNTMHGSNGTVATYTVKSDSLAGLT